MAATFLQSLVIHRCRELGTDNAAEYFGVGPGLIRQWVNGSKSPSLAAVEKVFTVPETPPKEAGWEGRDVFIALPFYKTTNPRTLFSLLGTWDRTKFRAGLEFDNALLIDAREKLASDFLSTTAEWCWWNDDDVISPMGIASWYNRYAEMQIPDQYAGIHTPTRLRSHGKSIVSALYVQRKPGGRGVYHEALTDPAETERVRQAPFDEIRPTEWAGLGCLIHNRKVLQDIQEKFPHLAPESSGEYFHFFSPSSDPVMRALPEMKAKIEAATQQVQGGTYDAAIAILTDLVTQITSAAAETKRISRLKQGEDETFGRRAAAAGHQTFVDFAVVCSHLGQKAYNPQNV